MRVFLPGTAGVGGWLPETCDLQWCDPRKWGWHLGADSHLSQTVPWDTLFGFSLTRTELILSEIQYILVFSLPSVHFTTQTWPTNIHCFSVRLNTVALL